ncbi:MAG: hypothetical protein CL484_00160 [Acidobacteria bacterium]|nr:hypothetical protein [Acidobacteriota bacterium]|tara:strand:- start:2540 stop:3097 length:558 start_codon:yes stop_codon:yes gene_type:complete
MHDFADWFPNPHAVVIHLPLGLLVTAVSTDLVALLRRSSAIVWVSSTLYTLGTMTLILAYLTGRTAASEVYTPGLAHALIAQHWNFALGCIWYFSLATLCRLARQLWAPGFTRLSTMVSSIVGLAGLTLLAVTAEFGGRLVYVYGVGVAAPNTKVLCTEPLQKEIPSDALISTSGTGAIESGPGR